MNSTRLEAACRRLSDMMATRRAGSADHQVLVGLVGRGIQASRTPRMHEREGERIGLSYSYVLIDFDVLGLADEDLAFMIGHAQSLGFAGLNVTHPFKQTVIGCLTDLSAEAGAIGAVNTIVFGHRHRIGHNTDSWGFLESFREGLPGVLLNRVVQFGAGGAGAAVAHAILSHGARSLVLCDPELGRAQRLAHRLSDRFGVPVEAAPDAQDLLAGGDGLINATPVGMDKYPGMPFAPQLLEARHWVAEIIYFPPETELLRCARALGCQTLAGAGMAVYQAVKAFELFTGLRPSREAMAEHFQAAA